MFIPDDEVRRRIETDENLLVRLLRPVDSPKPSEIVVPEEIPSLDDILEISSPDTTQLSSKSLGRLLNIDSPGGYKGRGTKGLHRDTQAAIGVTAGILGTTKASRLGEVAISQAHSYERGYTDPTTLVNPLKTPKQDLQEKIIAGHSIVVDKCFSRLLSTLDLLDDDKLEKVQKASELSVIAKNLSGVIAHATQSTQDKNTEINEKSVHFHIMRPEQATDADYPVVEVNSEKEELAWREKSLS